MDMDQYIVDVDSRYPDFSDMNKGEHIFYPSDARATMGRRFSAESNMRLNNVEPVSRYAPKVEAREDKLYTLPLRARTLDPNTAPHIGPVQVGNYKNYPKNCGSGGLCCENMTANVSDVVNNFMQSSQVFLFIMFVIIIFYSLFAIHNINKQLSKISKLLRSLKTTGDNS